MFLDRDSLNNEISDRMRSVEKEELMGARIQPADQRSCIASTC